MTEELTRALDAAFTTATAQLLQVGGASTDASEAAHTSSDATEAAAAQQWMRAVHAAFYAPVPRGVSTSGNNKFLELETVLTHVLARLCSNTDSHSSADSHGIGDSSRHSEQEPSSDAVSRLLGFMVRVTLLLCQELPAAKVQHHDELAAASDFLDVSVAATPAAATAAVETVPHKPVGKRGKQGKGKKASQPITPLAFIVVNALRNLTQSEDAALQRRVAQRCRHEGKTNTALLAFCSRGLEDPSAVDQKLLVEVLELFDMTHVDALDVQRAARHLTATRNHAVLMKLCRTFAHVDWDFLAIVQAAARSKDWTAAELLARTFERDGGNELAKGIVDVAIGFQEFKRAHRLVYNFSLQHEYPDIDLMYNRDGLLKLIEKQRWQIAMSFVGSDAVLQRLLLDHLVVAGEFQHARVVAQWLGLDNFAPSVAQLASQAASWTLNGLSHSAHAAALHGFLDLPLRSECVMFCDREVQLRDAMCHFFGVSDSANSDGGNSEHEQQDTLDAITVAGAGSVVGLDVEWKPATSKIAAATGSITTTAVASILQIASRSRVFLIDLLALHDNDYLFDVLLARLFRSRQILKVGFGFDSDLKVLHQTFPDRAVFMSAAPFLELSTVVLKALGASAGNSLSNATSRILGKPLDKSMQLSNWDERPLSPSQTQYAALDAFCLVQIVEKLCTTEDASHGDTRVLTWQDASVHIGELVHSSPLSGDAALDAVHLRTRYHAEWQQQRVQRQTVRSECDAAGGASSSSLGVQLLTSDDVAQFWLERCAAFTEQCGADAGAKIDTTIKFLPSKSIKELLAASAVSTDTNKRNFLAINSICFFADELPCVACIDANCKLDTAQIALFAGVGRRRVKLATALECHEVFGFAPGTVPPFGHRVATAVDGSDEPAALPRIFADRSLQHAEYLVGGGATHDALLWVSSQAFFALIDIEAVGDIQRSASSVASNRLSASGAAAHAPASVVDATTGADLDPAVNRTAVEIEMKFVADSMVARVGKWLRTIGIDVVIWDPYAPPGAAATTLPLPPPSSTASATATTVQRKKSTPRDPKAALLALAATQQRILLTRDKKLADRRDAGACFVVSSDDPFQQFQEIKAHFALQINKDELMSRCALCNAKAFMLVDAEYARTQTAFDVPARVLETVTEFWVCTVCQKIFWEGPKFSSAYDNVMRMFHDEYAPAAELGWHRDRGGVSASKSFAPMSDATLQQLE